MENKIRENQFGLESGDTVVIKAGSNILLEKDNMRKIIDSIDYLMKIGLNVFFVSSGAVAFGREIMREKGKEYGKSEDDKAFLSSIGQGALMNYYLELTAKKEITFGQNLLTHADFKTENLENILQVWKRYKKDKILAIINENDLVSREELKFSDNDELAGLVAKAVNAKVLILLSNEAGVYKDYKKEEEKLISEINDILEARQYCEDEKSSNGTGGMSSKLNVMEKMIQNGITGILAHGAEENIVEKILFWDYKNRTVFRV